MAPRTSEQVWSERHRSAVRETAPEVPDLGEAEQNALWHRIEAAALVPRSSRRPRRKAVVAGAVAVVAIGFAGAAAAGVISAHTGRGPTDAEDIELGGPGERLNPAAPDFATVLDEATVDIRFPSAASRNRSLAWEVEDLSDESDALVSTGALRLWMAGHALCSWSDVWAVALKSGDTAAQARAAGMILGARYWPAIADTDGEPGNQSEAAWLPALERAVEDEDPSAAKVALGGNGTLPCMPGLAPALGLGKQW